MANTVLTAGALLLLVLCPTFLVLVRRRRRGDVEVGSALPEWDPGDVAARATQSEAWLHARLGELGQAPVGIGDEPADVLEMHRVAEELPVGTEAPDAEETPAPEELRRSWRPPVVEEMASADEVAALRPVSPEGWDLESAIGELFAESGGGRTEEFEDPFGGAAADGQGEGEVGELEAGFDEEAEDEISKLWEEQIAGEYEMETLALTWAAPGPVPLHLSDTIGGETPFAHLPQGVASLLELEESEEVSPGWEGAGTEGAPRRRSRFSRMLRRRRKEPVVFEAVLEERAFQTESSESRSLSAYERPTVDLDPLVVPDEPLVPVTHEGVPGVEGENGEGHVAAELAGAVDAVGEGGVLDEESAGAGSDAVLEQPAPEETTASTGAVEDLRAASVLEVTAAVSIPVPPRTRRSVFGRRRRETPIEKLEVGQWESWNSPDAFGEVAEDFAYEPVVPEEPENAILATPTPELPLSFELDDLPDDFDTELSFLGPSPEYSHSIEDGIVIAAPIGSTRSGSKRRGWRTKRGSGSGDGGEIPGPDGGNEHASETSPAGPVSSWFDASVRGGPSPALTPGEIVDYSRHDLPEAIPDRVAVTAGTEEG